MATSGATTIIVIRHAEKPGTYGGVTYSGVDATGAVDSGESLTTVGWQRAGALVTLFAPPWRAKTLGLPQPQHIFAADPASAEDRAERKTSHRAYQTVTPLAALLALRINKDHRKKDYDAMVTQALAKNGVVLVCWQHETIPLLGQSILRQTDTAGISIPSSWPTGTDGSGRYDLTWVFQRPSGSGPISEFSQIAQMLLAGDAPAPAV
jgi:hypothetical protein